jgi:hypothetical protein
MRTDAKGEFEVRALPLGCDYGLIVRAAGYGREQIGVDTDKAPDNRVAMEPIVLATADLTVTGVVLDTNDNPVALALVRCSGEGQEGDSTLTSTDGRFTLDGLCKGRIRVSATVGGARKPNLRGSIQTQAGATDVKVVMTESPVPLPKGRTCFPGETDVWANGAVVPISEVSRGREEPGVPFGCLERIDEHEGAFECRDILFDSGNRISVVDSHCFMLDSGRWIAAQDLRAGQRLKTMTGTVGIKTVTLRPTPYKGKVYNLKINNSDRYAVGKDGVIVRDY